MDTLRGPLRLPKAIILLSICALVCACAGPSAEVHATPPRPVVDPASLCHDLPEAQAPAPRVVAGYPLAVPVLSKDEMAARGASAQSADWPQVRVDRFGLLESAGTRRRYRAPGYPVGDVENGERPEDVAAVQRFVDANPTLFGADASERVAGHGRIGTEWVVRYWGSGVISMQSIHTEHFLAMLAAGRVPPPARDANELLAPWVGSEIVRTPMPAQRPPCDPVTPSGRECAYDPPAPPPPSLSTFDATRTRAPKTALFRDEPPALRSIAEVVLAGDERPCHKLPHFIDAVTGEVLEWTPPLVSPASSKIGR